MYNLLKLNRAFFLPYLSILMVLVPLLLVFSKESIHLFINDQHSLKADYFYKYITHLGDGFMPLILAIVYLFNSIRKSFIIITAGLLAGAMAQFFKRIVFPDIVRPIKYFEGVHDLYLVEGVHNHGSFSFPSGHSATIFALCLCLAFFSKNNMSRFFLFVIALLVSFSRVYISQHFLNDIIAGSFLGCLAAFLMYYSFGKIENSWIDKPLSKLLIQKQSAHE